MNARPQITRYPAGRRHRLPALCFAFLATCIGGQAQAIDVPPTPLQTVAEFPPPNVRFILDDSGSMRLIAMPAAVAESDYSSGTGSSRTGLRDDIFDKSYVNNSLYFNPANTYQAWKKADGTRYTTGTAYTSAWHDPTDLSTATDLSAATQIWFVPKSGATDFSSTTSFDRYRILPGGTTLEQHEFWSNQVPTGYPKSGLDASTGTMLAVGTFEVPAGFDSMTITSSGGTRGTNGGCNNNRGDGADLYLRRNAAPTTSVYDFRNRSSNNNESRTVSNPTAGTWHIGLHAASCFKNVTVTVTLTGWKLLATSTASAALKTNFATWYSYHRSRIKTAKAGASEAFSDLTERVRIGFDTINRNSSGLPYNIPVGTDGGLFRDTNKSVWFDRLFDVKADGSTLLHRALQRAGNYFGDTSSSGPWGPESGAAQVSCRQNFAILTTDGWWNSTTGYTAIGDADNTAGPTHTPATGAVPIVIDGTAYTGYRRENPYRDNFSTSPSTRPDTLADVALHYWKNDLRPDLANNVPASASNPAFWQHMSTFGVSIGLQGTLSPTSETLNNIRLGITRWPDPISNTEAARIDDLWHASVNSRGGFVTANNAEEFQRGLQEAFAVIAQRQGTASNVTANSTTFIDQTRLYQASYTTRQWAGELQALSVSASGIGNSQWLASTGIPAVASRKVYTWNGSQGATFPTVAQTAALDQSARALSPVSGANNAAYIKGERSMEGEGAGKGLRVREHLFGDIIHSSPFYVKDTETVFVGANDGMLHAINATNGVERFAYVPAGLNFTNLASLSDPYYTHQYFVDGPIAVSAQSQTNNKNYLVATLGRGGKGLFALDVTTPDSFDPATDVLWELTSGTNLGMVLGDPIITKLNDANATQVAIFGNGINSTSGKAVLYVVNLSTGAILHELDTLAGSDNGLMAPRGADLDGDGKVDHVFAGDLKGNLWRFDFSGATPTIALSGTPLFAAGTTRPMTGGLALAREPATNRLWVFAGTGRFISSSDLADNNVQAMYGMHADSATALTAANLQNQEISLVTTLDGRPVRAFAEHAALDAGKKGWYVELDQPTPGERVITRPLVRQQVLIFASLIPPTSNTCAASGSGFVNALDAFTGTSTSEPYFLGENGSEQTLPNPTVGGNPLPVGSIDVGVGQPTQPVVIDSRLFVGGTCDAGVCLEDERVNPSGGEARRDSWREIIAN